MRTSTVRLQPALAFALAAIVAPWASGCETDLAVTATPVAVISGDQSLRPGAEGVLDGSASYLPGQEGAPLEYEWRVVTAPAGEARLDLGAPAEARTTVSVSAPGLWVVSLRVTSGGRQSAPAFANVRGYAPNLPPLADAGPDQVVDPNRPVQLDGRGSTDPNQDVLTYAWTQLTGMAVTLDDPASATPTYTAPLDPETATFQLTVTDPKGLSSSDQVSVAIRDLPPVAVIEAPDTADEYAHFVLDGTYSYDPNGQTVSGYQWTLVGPPGLGLALDNPNVGTPSFDVPHLCGDPGDVTVALTVTARDQQSETTVKIIHLGDVENDPPGVTIVAPGSAGEGTQVTLDGSQSTDCNGDVLTYTWTGPDDVVLSDPSGAVTTFTAPTVYAARTLTFTLTVDDGRGGTDSATFDVEVPNDVNEAPVVETAADVYVDVVDPATLTATATDPNGDPVTGWEWTQTGGPSVSLSGADTASVSFQAPATPGAVELAVRATDGTDWSAPVPVVVHVRTGPPDLSQSGIAVADGRLVADGAEQTTVTVTIRDAGGNALVGTHVVIQTTAGTLLGTVTDQGDGTYTQALQAPTSTATDAVLTYTADGTTDAAQQAVVAFDPGLPDGDIVLAASPPSIVADGASTTTVATTSPIADAFGNPVADGTPVTLTTTLGGLRDAGAWVGSVDLVTSGGHLSATLRSDPAAGVASLSATTGVGSASGQLDVTFHPGPPAGTVTVTAADATLTADGQQTTAVGAGTFVDAHDNQVEAGTLVTVTVQGGTPSGTDADPGTPGFQVAVDAQGQVSFDVTAGTDAGPMTIGVSSAAGDALGQTTVTLLPGPPAGPIVLHATPAPLVVSGTTSSSPTASTVATEPIKDANDNLVADGTVVTFATTGLAGCTLGGSGQATATATTTNGVASVVLHAGTVSGTAQVEATAATSSGTTSVEVQPGPPTDLAYVSGSDQTTYVGSLVGSLIVSVTDVHGNPVPGVTVTWTALEGDGSSVVNPTTTTGADGTAATDVTVGTRVYDPPEYHYEAAAAPGGTALSGSPVAFRVFVNPGPVKTLAFTTEPSDLVAGETMAPAVVVELRDFYGNPVSTSGRQVQLTLYDDAAGTQVSSTLLEGTPSAGSVSGVVTFPTLTVTGTGTFWIQASSPPGVTPEMSAAFTVSPAAEDHLAFSVQPADALAGAPVGGPPTVQVRDVYENVVPVSGRPVTVSLTTNAGGATLAGTLTQALSAGVAAFPDLTLDKPGTGYRLGADDGSLPAVTSAPFAIDPGPATALAFDTAPQSLTAGACSAEIDLVSRDALGNPSPPAADTAVTLTASNGTLVFYSAAGCTAGSEITTATLPAAGGLLPIWVRDTAAGTTTLTASASGLTDATQDETVAAGAASALAMAVEPTGVLAGDAISPAVEVRIVDAYGNPVTGADRDVTVALLVPGAATLGGTLTVTSTGGVASFGDLTVDTAGTYQLTFQATGLTGVDSASFVVTAPCTPSVTPAASVADALPWDTVTLSLSSADSCGATAPTYAWAVTAEPAGAAGGFAPFASLPATASGATADYYVTAPGTYTFEVTMTAGAESAVGSVSVTVHGFASLTTSESRALALVPSRGDLIIGAEGSATEAYRPNFTPHFVALSGCLSGDGVRVVRVSPSELIYFGNASNAVVDIVTGYGPSGCSPTPDAVDATTGAQGTAPSATRDLVLAGTGFYQATDADLFGWTPMASGGTEYTFTSFATDLPWAAAALDASGHLWFASDASYPNDGTVRTSDPPDAASAQVNMVTGTRDRAYALLPVDVGLGAESMVLSTSGNGIVLVPDVSAPDANLQRLSVAGGQLPAGASDVVHRGTQDASGDVWITTRTGLLRYKADAAAYVLIPVDTWGLAGGTDLWDVVVDDDPARPRTIYVASQLGVLSAVAAP